MVSKRTHVKTNSEGKDKMKPFHSKSHFRTCDLVEQEGGEDIFFIQGKKSYQLFKHKSPFFNGDEYTFTGTLVKGQEVCFVHKDGRRIPVQENSNCGYTLVGKARQYFEAKKALCANGEDSDDQEYIYINKYSELYYVGETGEHSVYIRIYDNENGNINDRWIVIYMN